MTEAAQLTPMDKHNEALLGRVHPPAKRSHSRRT